MTAYSISDYDRAVAELVAKGFAPSVAATEVRRQLLGSVPSQQQLEVVAAIDERVVRSANILEKAELVEVRKLFIAYGFLIYQLSQPRATKQTPGLFDLWCVHTRLPLALWFDVKRQVGGVLSSAQKEFQERTRAAGIRCESGDRYAVVELLIDLELAVRGAGQYGIEPVRLKSPQPTY